MWWRFSVPQLINPVPGIRVGGYIENRGVDLYRLAKEKGLEGIIAKRKTITTRAQGFAFAEQKEL